MATKKAAAKKPAAPVKKPAAKKTVAAPAKKPAAKKAAATPVGRVIAHKLVPAPAAKKAVAAPDTGSGAVSLKVLAEKVENVSRGVTTFWVDPRIIEMEEGFNGRDIDPAHVASIKQAKRDGAAFDPLKVSVHNGRVIVRDGHHRLTADMERIAEGEEIDKVQCLEFKGDAADRIALMIGSGLGKPLLPLELGVQYKKLHDSYGWEIKKIASRFGKSDQHVRDMIALTEQESDVKEMVKSGQVSAATALKVAKKSGSNAGKVLAAGLEVAKASGKKKLTPKNVPRAELGVSYVAEVKERAVAAKTHLLSMLDSPGMSQESLTAVDAVLKLMKVNAAPRKPLDTNDIIRSHLMQGGAHPDERVRSASSILYKCMTGAQLPPPAVMSLAEAIDMEMKSGGSVMAETLCPEHSTLIAYLRSAGVK